MVRECSLFRNRASCARRVSVIGRGTMAADVAVATAMACAVARPGLFVAPCGHGPSVADRVAADGMLLRAIAIVGNREIGDFTGNLDFDAMGLDPFVELLRSSDARGFRQVQIEAAILLVLLIIRRLASSGCVGCLGPGIEGFSTRLLVRGPNSSSLNRASICATSTVPNVRSSISTLDRRLVPVR